MGARIYPSGVVWEEGHGSERVVYEACRDGLDSAYSVFWSVPRLEVDAWRKPRDGEADFVIAHPQLGITVLEVKGGVVLFDEQGRWWSRSRGGKVHPIKDPFTQGVTAAHSLEDKLQPQLKPAGRYLRVGHAAIFPESVAGDTLHGLDKPQQIVLDATDLGNIGAAVERVLAFYRGKGGQHDFVPGTDGVAALKDLLYRPWQLQPVLWSGYKAEQERMIELTAGQYMVLDMLDHVRRAAISGCAGSGKTLVAAEKAVRLARGGEPVLLTCYNKNLAAWLREHLSATIEGEGLKLDVVHFHELCDSWARRAGIVLPTPGEDMSEFFNETLPQALMDAAGMLPDRYHAIVVDEGQDFLDAWWIPLQMLLRDPDAGTLYIFYDDNQRIYVESNEFPIPADHTYPLTLNCRNTQSIHQFVSRFYQGTARTVARGPEGKSVDVRYFAAGEGLHKSLADVLARLTTGKDAVPSSQIVVLTPFGRGKSRLWDNPLPGKLQLGDGAPAGPNEVYCGTIQGFKGLERPVVVLAELERWPLKYRKLDSLLYVGGSRASNQLIVLLPQDAPEEIRALVRQS